MCVNSSTSNVSLSQLFDTLKSMVLPVFVLTCLAGEHLKAKSGELKASAFWSYSCPMQQTSQHRCTANTKPELCDTEMMRENCIDGHNVHFEQHVQHRMLCVNTNRRHRTPRLIRLPEDTAWNKWKESSSVDTWANAVRLRRLKQNRIFLIWLRRRLSRSAMHMQLRVDVFYYIQKLYLFLYAKPLHYQWCQALDVLLLLSEVTGGAAQLAKYNW